MLYDLARDACHQSQNVFLQHAGVPLEAFTIQGFLRSRWSVEMTSLGTGKFVATSVAVELAASN
jgi:hypothetical protein